jgi:membrane protein
MNTFNIVKSVFNSIIKDDCLGMASSMAFNLILTIFPFFVAITAIFGMLGTEETISQILLSIKTVAPPSALYIVEQTLRQTIRASTGGVLTISIIIGILFASNAIKVLMNLLNKAYGLPETRPAWKTRGLTIWVIVLFIIAVIIITNLIILGKVILHLLDLYIGLHHSVINVISLLRWPITFLMLFTIGFIIYYFIPNITSTGKNRFLSSIPGTLFFTVGWLVVSWLFGLYVNNFGNYNRFYGAMGAVIILLIWLYYTSLVILVGGEINSVFYKYLKTREKNF